jgi:hypothetical protein
MPGDIFTFDFSPFGEDVVRECDGDLYVRFHQIPSRVVVGSLAVSLELGERVDYVDQLSLKRSWISLDLRSEPRSHRAVAEHATQPGALIREFSVLDEVFHEEMEDRVVSSGDGPAHK